jgi:hypothetical protein
MKDDFYKEERIDILTVFNSSTLKVFLIFTRGLNDSASVNSVYFSRYYNKTSLTHYKNILNSLKIMLCTILIINLIKTILYVYLLINNITLNFIYTEDILK